MYTKISINQILIFKTASGDELVGEVLNFDSEEFLIKKPMQVQIISDGKGGHGKVLMPFLMLAPEASQVPFLRNTLITFLEADKAVADAWRQETSGILLSTQLNG